MCCSVIMLVIVVHQCCFVRNVVDAADVVVDVMLLFAKSARFTGS